MSRVRRNFITGTLGASLATGGTSITFTTAPQLPNISTPDYAALIINPTPYGAVSSGSEIVYLTSYAGGTGGTVTRAQEGTSSPTTWVSGTPYALGVLSSDFTLVSGMNNGDFPTPTASGQLFVSTASGASNPSWTKTVSGLTITGSTFAGGSIGPTTINSSSFNGGGILTSIIYSGNTFNAGSVPGSAVTGALSSNTTASQTWSNYGATTTVTQTVSGYNSYLLSCNRTYYSSSTSDQIIQTLKIGATTVATANARITPTSAGPDVVSLSCTCAYSPGSTAAFTVSYTYTGGTGVNLANGLLSVIGFN